MSNTDNIYNILNNFNKIAKDAPAPVAATPKAKTKLQESMEQIVNEKYMGFKKTVAAIKKGGGAEDPEAVAAAIGRKKYGKEKFQKAAATGKKLGEASSLQSMADQDDDHEIVSPGMKTQYGTIVSVDGNDITVRTSTDEFTTMDIRDIKQAWMAEGTVKEGAMSELHLAFADVYDELAPRIEKHKDSVKAGQLYDALKTVAEKNGAMQEFSRMMRGARYSAHQDYDTNPGGFENWFWYLPFGDDLKESVKQGVAENYPKHQDLSGISTEKLKAYIAKQGQQQVSGEGAQVRRVRAELERRMKGVAEGNLKEFAPVGGDDREPNEEEILRQLAAQWWNGTEQQMAKAQKTLASMGISIDEDDPDIILRRGTQFLKFPMDDFQQGVAEGKLKINYDSWLSKVPNTINDKMKKVLSVMQDGKIRSRADMLRAAGIEPNPRGPSGVPGMEGTDYHLYKKGLLDVVDIVKGQKYFKISKNASRGMAEGSAKAYMKHNNLVDLEKPLDGLKNEFEKFLQTHDPEEKQKYQQGIKQRMKTKPMAGPKGQLPEQAIGQRLVKGEYSRVLDALRLYYPRLSMEELNVPGYHKVVADKANVPVEYAAQVINDFVRANDPDEDEFGDFNDDKQGMAEASFPTVADARKRAEQEKGTGKFTSKKNPDNPSGTIYTRKYNPKSGETDDTENVSAEKRGRGRPKKSAFEDMSTIDKMIAESFGELFEGTSRPINDPVSKAAPTAPGVGSSIRVSPMPALATSAPTKPTAGMGTIKGGVWTATPPKPGEQGVPVPQGIDEGPLLDKIGTGIGKVAGSIVGGAANFGQAIKKGYQSGMSVDADERSAANTAADAVNDMQSTRSMGQMAPDRPSAPSQGIDSMDPDTPQPYEGPRGAARELDEVDAEMEGMRKLAGLKGGQKKLDRDQDGELTAKDFDMLRKGLEEGGRDDYDEIRDKIQWLQGAPNYLSRDEAKETAYYTKDTDPVWNGYRDDADEIDEGDMEEGNAFSKTVVDAKADGVQPGETISVGGKEYDLKEGDAALNQMRRIAGLKECGMSPISGMASDMEKQQGNMNISTSQNSDGTKSVTITAAGDAASDLMQMLKLAGMGGGAAAPAAAAEPEILVVAQDGEEAMEEEKDPRYQASTTPDEQVAPIQALTKGGNGEVAGQEKTMKPGGYQFGDNNLAMQESLSAQLMKEYNSIKVKK